MHAVEQAADDLFGTATGEAENVIEAARRTRERAVREIAEASAQIERALDDAEAALSLARWSSSPGDRRGGSTSGRWNSATRASGWTAHSPRSRRSRARCGSSREPGEEEQELTITFGWGGIGKTTPPPGSARVS